MLRLTGYQSPDEAQPIADSINAEAQGDPTLRQQAFEHLKALHGHLVELAQSVPHPRMTGAVRAAEAAQQSHDTGDIRGAVAHVTSIKSAMGSIRTAMSTSPDPNGVLANHAGKAEQSVANFLDVLTPAKVGTNNQRGAARRFGVSVNPSFMASSKILRENHVKKLQNARNRKPTNG